MTFASWIADNRLLAAVLTALVAALVCGGFTIALTRMPRRALWTVLPAVAVHFLTYFPPKLIPTGLAPHDLSLPLDAAIPLWTPAVAVYVLAFAQWTAYWLLLGWQGQALRSRYLAGELLAKLLCAVVFVVFPTTLMRPAAAGGGVFDRVLQLVYLLDTPTNLLPSVHCLQSWLCARMAFEAKSLPKWVAPVMAVFSMLVFCSTLLVKQHVLVDLPAAIFVAELGLWLGRATRLDAALTRLENRKAKRE